MSTHSGDRWENASHSAYFTICGLAVTLIFDLLIIIITIIMNEYD